MHGVFISHTHSDQPIAEALTRLLEGLFGSVVRVNYSSRTEKGGIEPGEDWFRWIVAQVKGADVALILLTPASIQKPWVVWEGGAVAGAAFAMQTEAVRVLPVTYGVRTNEIPTPFARTQLIDGTRQADTVKLLTALMDRFEKSLDTEGKIQYGMNRATAVTDYLAQIGRIMRTLPLTVTEASVQEWLGRLADLEAESRFSETQVMESWLDVAFGRDKDDRQRPFDVRIHRRLGELYAASKEPAHAARQFDLARQLTPRDIFLLRRLGKAYLDLGDLPRVEEVLKEIEDLDPSAFTRNSENAALKARLLGAKGNPLGVRDLLEEAFKNMPTSYYLGDLLGQALVAQGDVVRAKAVYQQVGRLISDLREQNVWTYATALSAALVCEDEIAIKETLNDLRLARPSRGELESIERGIGTLAAALRRDKGILKELGKMEAGQ